MQEKLESELKESRFPGSAGGGVVEVAMDGSKKLLSVKIDPAALDPDDVEMLEDMVVAAVNEASRKVDEHLASQMSGLTGLLG